MGKQMKTIVDNAAGPTGVVGYLIAKLPDCPNEWLVFFSTALIICQLVHWGYRLYKWIVNSN